MRGFHPVASAKHEHDQKATSSFLVKHLVSLLVYIHALVSYILICGIIWSWGGEHEKSYIQRHPSYREFWRLVVQCI